MKALLFPGQGSQHVGMGNDLFEAFPAARAVLLEADEILGYSLTKLMFSGPEEELRETSHAQPAILAHSLAVWAALSPDWAPDQLMAAGHSLGEYSAYTVAGALTFEAALRIVRRRGELMSVAGRERPGAMAAVLGLDPTVIEEVCGRIDGVVVPANLNSPGQVVISGEVAAVRDAAAALRTQGAKRVVELKVSGAFHSPLMEPAVAGLREALAAAPVEAARFPVYANASGRAVTEPEEIRASLARQIISPVRWDPSVRAMARAGAGEFIEVGPGQVLRGLTRQIDRTFACRSLGTVDELRAFKESD